MICEVLGVTRHVGIDAGAESVKVVEIAGDGDTARWVRRARLEHAKDPGPALLALLRDWGWETVDGVAATGRLGRQLAVTRIPAKQARIEGHRFLHGDGRSLVIDVGAHGFSVLDLGPGAAESFRENPRCSQGTGNFLRQLVERFGLAGLERRQTGGLSGGQRRRLAVAVAFVGRPDLVLLDESTVGLDVEARQVLWDAVRAFHVGGGTVVLTSHHLEEVEALAERVVVIDEGRVRVDGTLAEVRSQVPARRVRLRAADLPELAGVERRSRHGDRHELWTADSDALVRELVDARVPFRDLEVAAASLEEACLVLTSPGAPATPLTVTKGSR